MRIFALWLFAGSVGLAGCLSAQAPRQGATYLLVHGAWGGSWDWRRVDSILTAHGHLVYRPGLTGLGERVHLASPAIGLQTHITDIVNVLVWEDLHDVILVGHSYGGMVITGVADQVPERIRHLIYLDAFLPDSGESVRALARSEMVTLMDRYRMDGLVPPVWTDSAAPIPKGCAATEEPGQTPDPFAPFAERAAARGWRVMRMEAGHVPNRTAPIPLAALLENLP